LLLRATPEQQYCTCGGPGTELLGLAKYYLDRAEGGKHEQIEVRIDSIDRVPEWIQNVSWIKAEIAKAHTKQFGKRRDWPALFDVYRFTLDFSDLEGFWEPYLRCSEATSTALAAHNERQKKLHFQPEEVNASIPASAHSTHFSSVAPATPSAPSTWPARMMGRPPGRLISATPSPMAVAVRECSEASIDSSPLGRPDVAEANAFPYDAR
jgi:hypothetical protein